MPIPSPGKTAARHRARAFFAALQRARQHVRRLPRGHGVRESALENLARRGLAAAAQGNLQVTLRGAKALLGNTVVHEDGPGDDLISSLTALGVGSLLVESTVDPQSLRQFACILGEGRTTAGVPEDDLVAMVERAQLGGIELVPAMELAPDELREEPFATWLSLPHAPAREGLFAAIDREASGSLPVQAARLLLEDLQTGRLGKECEPLLAPLLDAMLADGDAASAAWLLARARAQGLGRATIGNLVERATARVGEDLGASTLDDREGRLEDVAALAIELGEDALAQCLSASVGWDAPDAAENVAALAGMSWDTVATTVATIDLALLPSLLETLLETGHHAPTGAVLARIDIAAREGADSALLEAAVMALRAGAAQSSDGQHIEGFLRAHPILHPLAT